MFNRKILVPILLVAMFFSFACAYIVLPEGLDAPVASGKESSGWSAVATNIGNSDNGDLHIDLTLRNETGDWSAMQAIDGEPAVLTSGGQTTTCATIFVSTGGHRMAPGFQLKGYTAGTQSEPVAQPIYVECAGAEAAAGASLSIPYSYVTGQYNYYEQDKNKVDGQLEVNLDQVAPELTYPVAEQIEGLIQESSIEIIALNKVVLTLTEVQRTDNGLQFTWKTANPGDYPSYVHIGNPPVIGADGLLYGFYETPDIVSVPITPAGGEAEWTTEVRVPADVSGFYILLSVETGKARLFANYVLDITSY